MTARCCRQANVDMLHRTRCAWTLNLNPPFAHPHLFETNLFRFKTHEKNRPPPPLADSWFEAQAIFAVWKSKSRKPTMFVLSIDADAGENIPKIPPLFPSPPPHTRYCKYGIGFGKTNWKTTLPCGKITQKKKTVLLPLVRWDLFFLFVHEMKLRMMLLLVIHLWRLREKKKPWSRKCSKM